MGTVLSAFNVSMLSPYDHYYLYTGSYVEENGDTYYSATDIILPRKQDFCISEKQVSTSLIVVTCNSHR